MSQEVIDIYKELSDNGIKESSADELAHNYQKLINEIGSDGSNRFREQIDELYRTFKDALMNEQKLIKLYKDLKKRHIEDLQKINKITEQQRDERKENEFLTKKLHTLQKEQQIAKEEKAKELISKTDLSQLSDKLKDDYSVDENQVEVLEKEKQMLKRQLEQMTANFEKIEKDYNDLIVLKDKSELSLRDFKDENVTLKEEKNKLSKDKEMLEKKIQDKDMEINKLKDFNMRQVSQNQEQNSSYQHLKRQYEDMNIKIGGMKNDNDKLNTIKNDFEKTNKELMIAIQDLKLEVSELKTKKKELNGNNKKLEKEKDKLSLVITEKEVEIREKNREIDKINKDMNALELQITAHLNNIRVQHQQIDKYKRMTEEETRQKHEQVLANKKQDKEIKKIGDEVKDLKQEVVDYEGDVKSKSEKLIKLKEELEIANKINSDLEKTRDKITEENTKLKNKIDHLLEDIRLRDNRIQELQKKYMESDKKLKMQREVYDTTKKDKNLYLKNLIETQDDLVDKQNLLNLNKKEIENLKSDLKKKDDYIVGLKTDLSIIEDLLKNKKFEAERNKNQIEVLKQTAIRLEKEIEGLKIKFEDVNKEKKKLDEEYKQTIINRDNLSSQLIRRNDEVSLLHEKIMILTSNLLRSEQRYQKKKEKINFYIRENRNLIRELEICNNYKEQASKFAKEIINLNKELLREKNLNKALTEEVESSEKLFHRWRKLEGIDPDSLEMHYKINLLQKRLISKTEECVEKEITIQDLTKELANCKKIANKRPVYEIEESVKLYKQELQKNAEKMKAIIAERNLHQNQAEDLKTECNRLKKENTELQMKIHENKLRLNKVLNNIEESKRSASKI